MFTVNAANGTLSKTGSGRRFSPGSIRVCPRHEPVTYTPRFAYTANLVPTTFSAFQIDAGKAAALTLAPTADREWRRRSVPRRRGSDRAFPLRGARGDQQRQAFSHQCVERRLTRSGSGGHRWRQRGRPDSRSLRQVRHAGNVDSANSGVPRTKTISTFAINPTPARSILAGTPVASGGSQPFSPRWTHQEGSCTPRISFVERLAFRINPGNGAAERDHGPAI